MIEVEAVTRKWGNSLGITLPKDVIEKERIKNNERIKILILKQPPVAKQTFGMLKGKRLRSGQQIKDDLRRELYND